MDEKLEFWGLVELFGHQKIAGKVSEETIGGCSFIRVDIPEVDGQQAITKYYGNGAIYSMTPVSEELVKLLVQQFQPSPINVYVPEIHQLNEHSEKDMDES